MIDDRPLLNLDAPPLPAKVRQPKRRVKAPLPELPPSPPAESWLITVAASGNGPPGIIRVRRFLKNAYRRHKLKCLRVECLGIPATPDNPTGNQSSKGHRGPQIGLGKAKMKRLVALRNKIATLAASLHENQ